MYLEAGTVEHGKQRYDTVGDWTISGKSHNPTFEVNVSKMKNWRYEFMVAIHELVEAALCFHRGIKEEDVTAFDILCIQNNVEGEPGDAPEAPYKREHFFATTIERMLCAEFGIDWMEYERYVNSL